MAKRTKTGCLYIYQTRAINMNKPNIGLTIGDPSGIGPEITAEAVSSKALRQMANLVVIGDSFVFKKLGVYKKVVANSHLMFQY